jgi:hypothetical protein
MTPPFSGTRTLTTPGTSTRTADLGSGGGGGVLLQLTRHNTVNSKKRRMVPSCSIGVNYFRYLPIERSDTKTFSQLQAFCMRARVCAD